MTYDETTLKPCGFLLAFSRTDTRVKGIRSKVNKIGRLLALRVANAFFVHHEAVFVHHEADTPRH